MPHAMTRIARTYLTMPAVLLSLAAGCRPATLPDQEARAELSSAAEEDPASELLARAIDAHGGEGYFDTLRAGRIAVFTRGIVTADFQDEITRVDTFQMPDKLRRETLHKTPESTTTQTYVRLGNYAWERTDNEPFKRVSELVRIEQVYPLRLLGELLSAQTSGTVKYAGEAQIDGHDAEVIRLTQGGTVAAEVAFDKVEYVILSITHPAYNPKSGRMGTSVTIHRDYERFGRLLIPREAITHLDGQLFVEKRLLSFENMEHVPPDCFAVPDP